MKKGFVMSLHVLAFVAVFSLLGAPFASAGVVLRSGEGVDVAKDQIVSGDFYAAGGTVANSGVVEGDLYAAAGSFTNNGVVNGDLSVIGGAANVHASVTDDVRLVGGEMIIAGPVGGDVVVFGGQLKILSTASIAGDVLFFGGDVQVLGPVAGSVLGAAEQVRIDARVGGGVDVRAGIVTLGDRAEVLGDVRYQSPQEITRGQNAVVVGEIVKNTAPAEPAASPEDILLGFIVLLFAVLVVQLLMRRFIEVRLTSLLDHAGMAGLVGIAMLILLPVLIVVLSASMLGLIIGLFLLMVFLATAIFAIPFMCVLIGARIAQYKDGTPSLSVLYTVLATLFVQLLMVVPVLGPLLVLVLYFITFGALWRLIYKTVIRA